MNNLLTLLFDGGELPDTSSNNQTKRSCYSKSDDIELIEFFAQEYRRHNPESRKRQSFAMWEPLIQEKQWNRTGAAVSSHFRKHILKNIYQYKVNKMDLFIVMHHFKTEITKKQTRSLEKRYKCKIVLDEFGRFVDAKDMEKPIFKHPSKKHQPSSNSAHSIIENLLSDTPQTGAQNDYQNDHHNEQHSAIDRFKSDVENQPEPVLSFADIVKQHAQEFHHNFLLQLACPDDDFDPEDFSDMIERANHQLAGQGFNYTNLSSTSQSGQGSSGPSSPTLKRPKHVESYSSPHEDTGDILQNILNYNLDHSDVYKNLNSSQPQNHPSHQLSSNLLQQTLKNHVENLVVGQIQGPDFLDHLNQENITGCKKFLGLLTKFNEALYKEDSNEIEHFDENNMLVGSGETMEE